MSDEILVNYYTINNKDYLVINEIDYKNNRYIYLVNELDNKDILIRKIINNELYPMDNEEELNEILKLITK